MRVELLTIGAELTSGSTVNTNAATLARSLASVGISCLRQITVTDERSVIVHELRDAMRRCDAVITTGGLGPTFDDVTVEALASATGRRLRYDVATAQRIRQFYTRRHRRLQRAALRQAYLPMGATALPNPIGTAPGLWLPLNRQLVVALPGVPGEMRAILTRHVLPRLRRLSGRRALASRTLRTVGIVELSIEHLLKRLRIPPHVTVGLYPHLRAVDVRLTATADSMTQAQRALRRLERPLRQVLGPAVYGSDADTLESVVGRLLFARRQTLAVAESCTGGLVSDRITDVAGSSRYFRGALVAYHNDLKTNHLAVAPALLGRFGAVSAPVAGAMARGVRRLAGADIGVSITGIAGPTGGSTTKPVGLVYVALADRRTTSTRRCQFFGDREAIKIQATQTALDWLRRYLLKSHA